MNHLLPVSILIFLAFPSLALGWTTDVEYRFKYSGTPSSGISKSTIKNEEIEIHCDVVAQSIKDDTILVKIEDLRLKANVNLLKNPSSQKPYTENFEILDNKFLSAPFSISHKSGLITSIQTGNSEPVWVVNFKKSIASQLQIDEHRLDVIINGSSAFQNGESVSFSSYEDSIIGSCKTNLTIRKLGRSEIENSEIFNFTMFDTDCRGNVVFEITKRKNLLNCKSDSIARFEFPSSFDSNKFFTEEFLHRSSVTKYLTCGNNMKNSTVIHAKTKSEMLIQPFAANGEGLTNSAVITFSLEEKNPINTHFVLPFFRKEHNTLSYTEDELDHENVTNVQVPVSTMHQQILNTLRLVEYELKEKMDGDGTDHLESLATIDRLLPMFSLEDFESLWNDVKEHSNIIQSLFVDCVVLSGTKPAVMLIRQLIESKQITGNSADSALSNLADCIKTPNGELLQELMKLLKSEPVRTSKSTTQTAMIAIASLLNRIDGSHSIKHNLSADLIIIVNDFLTMITKELEAEQDISHRIIILSILGKIGVEEILPILLPIIHGSPVKTYDTADRLRAILSLSRVAHTVPEKIHPLLVNLADDVSLRPEIRMASLGVLLLSNADISLWKHFAARTWTEPSRQMESFIYHLINSLTEFRTSNRSRERAQKAQIALALAKPSSFKFSFSFADTSSFDLDQSITVMMQTFLFRDPNQSLPAYVSNSYSFHFGPWNTELLRFELYNCNMADSWRNVVHKLYNRVSTKYSALWSDRRANGQDGMFQEIWDELKISSKHFNQPPVGLLHVNLFGSIDHFFHLAKLDETIPKYMIHLLKYHYRPYRVSFSKYHMLANHQIRLINEMGFSVRYLLKVPVLASIQGTVKSGSHSVYKSDLNSQLNWKLKVELRVDTPFDRNSIASGVDYSFGLRLPKQLSFRYNKGELALNWTLGHKVADFYRYEVKPFTINRRLKQLPYDNEETTVPHLMSDTSTNHNWPLGDLMGVNLRLVQQSTKTDPFNWRDYLTKKTNPKPISNFIFPPLDGLHHRKLLIRYDPSGTRARSVSINLLYRSMEKVAKNTLIYESGSNQSRILSDAEVVAYSRPVISEFGSLIDRLFNKVHSGPARLMKASLASEQMNETVVHLRSILGLATSTANNKDVVDWYTEYSTSGGSNTTPKHVDFAFCYTSHRNWNNPPSYGFSQDILALNQVDNIGYGPSCENKAKFIAKVYRDKEAALAAINTPSGQQCLLDMESAFKYGSPVCSKARILDHLYNNYELFGQMKNLSSQQWQSVVSASSQWLNNIVEAFSIKRIDHAQSSVHSGTSLIIKHYPPTGKSDVTLIHPHETLIAKNVGLENIMNRLFLSRVFPLSPPTSNFIVESLKSNWNLPSKCYVGSDAVFTFDGVGYNYTIDECLHVLLADCDGKSELIVSAKSAKTGHKIVTVMYGKDVFVLEPNSYVTVNGAKTNLNELERGAQIQIYSMKTRSIKVVVESIPDGIVLDMKSLFFQIKVQRSHVEISAPFLLRSKVCGLCGDYDHETNDEFRSHDGSILSSGKLMAESFKLKSTC